MKSTVSKYNRIDEQDLELLKEAELEIERSRKLRASLEEEYGLDRASPNKQTLDVRTRRL